MVFTSLMKKLSHPSI